MPSASMTKPEPSELTRRGCVLPPLFSPWPRRFLKNSSKNSSNGEPGGTFGPGRACWSPPPGACARRCAPPLPAATVCDGRDVDHRIDHALGDVGDLVGTALRERGERERERRPPARSAGRRNWSGGAKVPAIGGLQRALRDSRDSCAWPRPGARVGKSRMPTRPSQLGGTGRHSRGRDPVSRYPRTNHTRITPSTADAMPTIAQRPVRRLQHVRHRLLGGRRADGEDQPLDHEHETERDDESPHMRTTRSRRRGASPRRIVVTEPAR